jgi:hypothetical protein
MDTNFDDELSILDIFDPLKQPEYPLISPSESDETIIDISASSSFSHMIKLRLKLSTCSELKPFCQLVQRIQDEDQLKEVKEKKLI